MKHTTVVTLRRVLEGDAPHTGARLETLLPPPIRSRPKAMPPTRGHDLKLRKAKI